MIGTQTFTRSFVARTLASWTLATSLSLGCASEEDADQLVSPAGSERSGAANEANEAERPLAQTADAKTFRNPLNTQQGSDPFMVWHEGNYYLMATTWSSELTIKKAPTIAGLKTAKSQVIWRGDNPSRCCNFWAPEMYLLDGPNGKHWYLYFTAGPRGEKTDNQRNFVLESRGTDPLGPYTMKARIFDPKIDLWAIDPSIMKLNGQLYFLFSAWDGPDQGVYIASMSNPWTLNSGRVRIGRPNYAWEKVLANVNEGPVALQRGGKTFIVYSASACWGPEYKLGMLTYTGGNPLNPGSWVKAMQPVFQKSVQNRVFGPAHNAFFASPDGSEIWNVYHANDSDKGVCDTKRTTRVQKVNWRADGTPDFGVPASTSMDLPVPAGE